MMPQNRNERLAKDYRGMMKIQDRPYLSWIATKGEPPYAEEYLLHVKLRTYVLSVQSDRYTVGAVHRCTVRVTLWDSYPVMAPYVKMLDIPPVFHPDWYSKGVYSPSEPWRPETSLKDYIMRMLATLCGDPEGFETNTPANYKALDWYMKNRNDASLLPSDTTELTENSAEETAALERAASSPGEIVDDHPFG
ncbi:MAG: hypothetical protein IJH40_05305 [Ruminococcus sp.]|uniref:hypothetical protein n=1 Tax=Ruminococcus sp. TaxID=41978 RepID=UPI0028739DF1|nr:hypothetical protein [Ruminococcus sp.]MBQ3285044.1 hypothetical protein [Ruminococcus sp.]